MEWESGCQRSRLLSRCHPRGQVIVASTTMCRSPLAQVTTSPMVTGQQSAACCGQEAWPGSPTSAAHHHGVKSQDQLGAPCGRLCGGHQHLKARQEHGSTSGAGGL